MVVRPARSARSLRSLAHPCATRSARSARSLRSLARPCATLFVWRCYARSSPPLRSPLALLGGRFGGAGLPRRFAPPPPRRVALPLWGLLPRPAPLRLAPWRPLSLRGVRGSPRALPVPRGHPRPCGGRGLQPPPPSSPLQGATRPLSPSLSAIGVRIRPALQPPARSPNPLAHPEGVCRFGQALRFVPLATPSATLRVPLHCSSGDAKGSPLRALPPL